MPDSVPAPESAAAQTFEAAMERLEAIVTEMENSRLPLEELIRCYEEGTRLVRVCNQRLTSAEQRIEIITRDASGEAQAVAFAPSAVKSNVREPKAAAEAPASAGRAAKKNNEVSLF